MSETAVRKPNARLAILLNLTLLGLLLLMWVLLSTFTRTFATENNFVNLMRQASVFAIIAIGQTFVIITAGIDLSVGAVVGFSGVLVASRVIVRCTPRPSRSGSAAGATDG